MCLMAHPNIHYPNQLGVTDTNRMMLDIGHPYGLQPTPGDSMKFALNLLSDSEWGQGGFSDQKVFMAIF